jgi:hypothetical protein
MAFILAILLALASIYNPATSGTVAPACAVVDGDTTGGPSGTACPPKTPPVQALDTTGGPSGGGQPGG